MQRVEDQTDAAGATGAWLAAAWAQRPVCRDIDAGGVRIACRAWGGDDLAKPGLVFVHGFRAAACWWDHIAPHFADRFRVVAFDLGGMGDSAWRESYGRADHAAELLGVIAAFNFDRPTIVAHSFGTVVTLYAAHTSPEKLGRLILVDGYPALVGKAPENPPRFYPDRATILARYRLVPPGRWPDPRIVDRIAAHAIRETPDGWTWKFDPDAPRTMERDVIPEALGHVPLPMSFVYGELTELIPADRIRAIEDWLPGCGAPVMVPMAHHHVMIEQPQALVAALQGLLSK